MVEWVEERARESKQDELGQRVASAQPSNGQAKSDDADIFDRVIGEQSLNVVLSERIPNAEYGGNERHCQKSPAIRGFLRRQNHHESRDAVDAGLDVDRWEQAGYMRGR